MTLDIRANVFCNVGEVISGQFADEYAQGEGLVRTRGSIDFKGVVRPGVGTVVNIGYEKNNVVSRINRHLLVLSVFVDPYKGVTTVRVGDPIVYADQLTPPTANDKKDPNDPNNTENEENPGDSVSNKDPEINGNLLCSAFENGPIPSMKAKDIVRVAAKAAGITLASDFFELQSSFNVDEFDFSSGFAQVIGDLLISENKLGFIDVAGELKTIDYNNINLGGPALSGRDLIEISPIGFGDLPADEVSTQYSSQRLKEEAQDLTEDPGPDNPDDETEEEKEERERLNEEKEMKRKIRDWEYEKIIDDEQTVYGSYTDYKDNEDEPVERQISTTYRPVTETNTTYDTLDRVIERTTVRTVSKLEAYGSYYSAALSWQTLPTSNPGFSIVDYSGTVDYVTTQTFEYAVAAPARRPEEEDPDKTAAECLADEIGTDEDISEVLSETTIEVGPSQETATPIRWGIAQDTDSEDDDERPPPPAFPSGTTIISSQTITYEKDPESGITKTTTCVYDSTSLSPSLSQAIATAAANSYDMNGKNASDSRSIQQIMARQNQARGICTVQIRQERQYGLERRPSQSNRSAAFNKKENPLEQVSEEEFITESSGPVAIKKTFQMPYAPDDDVEWDPNTGYKVTGSRAAEFASAFGETQNKLLYGNRNGISIKTAIDKIPPYPMGGFFVDAPGLSGFFLNNGMTFAFDGNGILVQTDGLYWGAQGTLPGGDPWLPLAPGAVLPSADAPTTNPNPAPPNSSPAPPGFDPTNPGTIFDDLPTDQDPVYEEEYNPDGIYPPYALKVKLIALVRTRSFGQPVPWDTSPQIQEHANKTRTFSIAATKLVLEGSEAFAVSGYGVVFTKTSPSGGGNQTLQIPTADYNLTGNETPTSLAGSTGNFIEKAFYNIVGYRISETDWTMTDGVDNSLWLDASTLDNFEYSDINFLNKWLDKSPNQLRLDDIGNPLIVQDELNGLNVLSTVSTSQIGFTAYNSIPSIVTDSSQGDSQGEFCYVILVKVLSASNTNSQAYQADAIVGDGSGYFGLTVDSNQTGRAYVRQFNTANEVTIGLDMAYDQWKIFSVWLYDSEPLGGQVLSANQNGYPASFASVDFPYIYNSDEFEIGFGFSGGPFCYIAESAFFKTYDEATRLKAEGFIAHKWGLLDLLPPEHPYKTVAPTIESNPTAPGPRIIVAETGKYLLYEKDINRFSPTGLGATIWLDSSGSTNYDLLQGRVVYWYDKSVNQFTFETNYPDGSGGPELWLRTGSDPGSIQQSIVRTDTANPPDSLFMQGGTDWSKILDQHSFSFFALFDFIDTTNNVDAEPQERHTLFGDKSGFFNFYVNNITGSFGVQAFNSFRYTVEVPLPILTNETMVYGGVAAGQLFLSVNGGPIASVPFAPGFFVSGMYQMTVGERATGQVLTTVQGTDVYIYEIIGSKNELTNYERQIMEGYICHKWGFSNALLPANHPFKSDAPPADVLRRLNAASKPYVIDGNDVNFVFTDNTP